MSATYFSVYVLRAPDGRRCRLLAWTFASDLLSFLPNNGFMEERRLFSAR